MERTFGKIVRLNSIHDVSQRNSRVGQECARIM